MQTIAGLVELLSSSEHQFVASLFRGELPRKARQLVSTVGCRFRKQLKELVERLEGWDLLTINLTPRLRAVPALCRMDPRFLA